MLSVLITGCNGGIGTELCNVFKKNNWTVIGTSLEDNATHDRTDLYIQGDLTDPTFPEKLILRIKNTYNRLDCIVNNAACQICKPIYDMNVVEWDKVYNCNVRAVYLLAKYGYSLLKNTQGNIINIASVHSNSTSDEIAAYASSKAAIVGLTKNLAIELGKFNIRVNSISPGAVDTQMLRSGLLRGHVGNGSSDELVEKLGNTHLLKRVGKPEEIANLAYFIGDKKNGEFINGANIMIDGGACIKLSTE